uniref:glutamine synthetase n=1 Tax=viral metagenome TaxID=1070528 RepID=A0A6C0J5D3_9ZZZZ
MDRIIEYVWIGGGIDNMEWTIRSKTKVLPYTNIPSIGKDDDSSFTVPKVPLLSNWNYDGSSTGQASGKESEVVLVPTGMSIKDPFNKMNENLIILCDTYIYKKNKKTGNVTLVPHESNNRFKANKIFNEEINANTDKQSCHPWYGLEQEYFLLDRKTKMPLGFNKKDKQGQYYCSVGASNAFGRNIVDEHLHACIYAGINISGINAEVAPGQWEFQVGPVEGIHAGDQLWMARYLLLRVAERHGVDVSFHSKPLDGNWNGSGCHCNYSTLNMREGTKDHNGLYYINKAIKKLEANHDSHMAVYGKDNDQRMTGKHETADYNIFTSGIGDRGASVRIGNDTYINGKGYFEDRRPSSSSDPYLVTSILFETTR